MSLKKAARYIHTVRHLKAKQILFRLYYACQTTKEKPITPQRPRLWAQPWGSSSFFSSNLGNSGDITFLSESGNINSPHIWNDPSRTKLWLYNLHYLDELNAQAADTHRERIDSLIRKWHRENPPYKGIGWEPYPLSLRLVNLIKYYSRRSEILTADLLQSLNRQASVLSRKIEYHILANHLFANGKALVFVGTYLEGLQANKWLQQGLNILDREIEEQFLNDGAHFELSPMYHAILLWDVCDLINLANRSQLIELQVRKQKWQTVLEQGMVWLSAMLHPDGDISFFNDATLGVAPPVENIKKYLAHLDIKIPQKNSNNFSLQHFKDSGYCVVNLGRKSKAIIDIAKIGPRYQPGHAHADTLSFELSLWGQRFLVNSGISRYGDDALRQYQRSTKAHNTLTINNENSSEIWAGFRVARRAYPQKISTVQEVDEIKVSCMHDGYKRLSGKNLHTRDWLFTKNNLIIRDQIQGKFDVAEARYYLHPAIQIKQVKEDSVICCFSHAQQVMMRFSGFDNFIVESVCWYPAFGSAVSNYCLVLKLNSRELLTQIEW